MTNKTGEETLNFEEAMSRMETLVEQMESAQLPLAELITRYEEGNRLLQICSRQLDAAENRVQMILKGAGAKPELTEFSPEKAPAESAKPAEPASVSRSPKPSSRVVDDKDDEISLF